MLLNNLLLLLLLNILNRIMDHKVHIGRLTAAAVVGSVWSCALAIWPYIPWILERFVTWAVIGSLMVKIAFPIRNCRELLKNVAALYLAAAALGGVMYALDVHTNTGFYIRRLLAGETTEAMPLFFWTFLLAGGYFGVRYLLAAVWSAKKERDPFYRVTLCYQGKEETVTAFLDGYYEKHPLDNSYEGILARRSGLTKDTVIALLDYADQIIFLANYDPTNYYPLPADELLVEVTKRVEINNKDASNSVSVILPNTYMAEYYQRNYAI